MQYFISGADRISNQKVSRAVDSTIFIRPISIVSTRPKNLRKTYAQTVIYAYQEPPRLIKQKPSTFNPIRVKL